MAEIDRIEQAIREHVENHKDRERATFTVAGVSALLDELSRRSEVIERAKEVRKALQLCVDMIVANGLERGLQNTLEVASAALSSKENELE
jgi:hypothetical protein